MKSFVLWIIILVVLVGNAQPNKSGEQNKVHKYDSKECVRKQYQRMVLAYIGKRIRRSLVWNINKNVNIFQHINVFVYILFIKAIVEIIYICMCLKKLNIVEIKKVCWQSKWLRLR